MVLEFWFLKNIGFCVCSDSFHLGFLVVFGSHKYLCSELFHRFGNTVIFVCIFGRIPGRCVDFLGHLTWSDSFCYTLWLHNRCHATLYIEECSTSMTFQAWNALFYHFFTYNSSKDPEYSWYDMRRTNQLWCRNSQVVQVKI